MDTDQAPDAGTPLALLHRGRRATGRGGLMPIPPLPPGLRYPSYDPVIQIGPELPPLVPPRRLFVSGGPLGSIQVSYRHGLPGQRVRVLAPEEVRPVFVLNDRYAGAV